MSFQIVFTLVEKKKIKLVENFTNSNLIHFPSFVLRPFYVINGIFD